MSEISTDISNSSTVKDSNQSSTSATISNELAEFIKQNDFIGWPSADVTIPARQHGWFRPGNREVLSLLLREDFDFVIELGSWLGLSTNMICQQCSNATVFAIDIWSNEYFYSDSHYNKEDTKFAEFLNKGSIYDQFLANTQTHKLLLQEIENGSAVNPKGFPKGLIPMKCTSSEGLKILYDFFGSINSKRNSSEISDRDTNDSRKRKHTDSQDKIHPGLIYIDASHHYDYVVADIKASLDYFPEALIVGDDWDNLDVRRAVQDVAKERNQEIYVHQNTCWTYAKRELLDALSKKRKLEQEEIVKQQQFKKLKSASFQDALKMMKTIRK